MKILIYVENGNPLGDDYVRFRGEYDDVLKAEAGMRDLVEKYRSVIQEDHDCKNDAYGTGHCEVCV